MRVRSTLVFLLILALTPYGRAIAESGTTANDEPAAPVVLAATPLGSPTAIGDALSAAERDGAVPDDLLEPVQRFYRLHGHRPAWLEAHRPTPAALSLLAAVKQADRDGLDPSAYPIALLAESDRSFTADLRAELDVRLTSAFLEFATALALGRTDPASIGRLYFSRDRQVDIPAILQAAAARRDMAWGLSQLRPPHPEYDGLRDTLARYRALESNGGWPSLPDDLLLREGDESEHVPDIRARLQITGDLTDAGAASSFEEKALVYDAELAAAVERFQARHGLLVDGIVGPQTLGAMNVPVEQRIAQIALNMERWRWIADDLGAPHVRVNIPGFHLDVREPGEPVLSMRVVVGTASNPTPVFSDVIEYLEFSPYWNIPASIAHGQTLPQARRDLSYLQRQRIDIVRGWGDEAPVVDPETLDWSDPGLRFDGHPYRFRQRSWPGNSLGQVKFMFPNDFNVYLHDTPDPHLFDRVERDFSHGCVRVSRPADLAHYLLEPDGWSRADVVEAMDNPERRVVYLSEAVPVHLHYMTTFVNEEGAVQFRDDLYGYDAKHIQARQREWTE